jgi:hypothetical protein
MFPRNTTSTAQYLITGQHLFNPVVSATYAAEMPKISCRFAFVKNASVKAKPNVNAVKIAIATPKEDAENGFGELST